ncbi:hypothetical protein Gogos_020681 [Gossypium gossypioides]|uniref:Uncharacterized protein n=1 Tax=Gossypium gossypioides TaxID=34282 RepID=A0A7J9D3I1_GOSGO|nr:hypothetical protein [Gossypium gossypioides]
MGKASDDRHLPLFAFVVYGLIVFPKALGYVSVELADFLFQVEKRKERRRTFLRMRTVVVHMDEKPF